MRMSGAEAIVACLLEHKVERIFGYPGGQVLPVYDALYGSSLAHVLTVHEQGAIHGADGYARASGKVGVCLATSGPGATNLVTGLANAALDSVPLVAITGQVPMGFLGKDSFQEVDIIGVTMPVTKHNFMVKEAEKLPELLRLAFRIAASGRPGPVLVDVPRDVQLAMLDYQPPEAKEPDGRDSPEEGLTERLAEAVEAVQASRRPVMVVGGGVIQAKAWQEAQLLAEHLRIPVVSTLMGLGAVPSGHPLFMGMTGMHGTKTGNRVVHEADLLIVVGSRLNDRVTGNYSRYVKNKTLIHIDIDRAEINKNVTAEIPLVGKLKQVLNAFYQTCPAGKECKSWWRDIGEWQEEYQTRPDGDYLSGPGIMQEISCQTEGKGAVFVTDVGQHQMWAAQHLKLDGPGSWITSGGLGTMGFGVPAAMGAQLAVPDKRVVLLVGDGGFKMTGTELYTIASQKLPVIVVILDNGCLGMVRQWQQLFYGQRYSASIPAGDFDFCGYARACGVEAVRTETSQAFAEAFAEAWASRAPQVIVAAIPGEELVKPMLVPGAGLNEYINE